MTPTSDWRQVRPCVFMTWVSRPSVSYQSAPRTHCVPPETVRSLRRRYGTRTGHRHIEWITRVSDSHPVLSCPGKPLAILRSAVEEHDVDHGTVGMMGDQGAHHEVRIGGRSVIHGRDIHSHALGLYGSSDADHSGILLRNRDPDVLLCPSATSEETSSCGQLSCPSATSTHP